MKVGIFLTTQYEENEDLSESLNFIIEQVTHARVQNLDSIWAGQHFATGPVKMFQPLPILSRIASESGDMQIGTAVSLLSMQNPARVAEEIATLDWITGGRVIFGAGIGYRDEEFIVTGHDKHTRAKRFSEAIKLVRHWWTDEIVNFKGDYFSIPGIQPSLSSYQKGGPKIWIAGEVEASVKRAALIGDAWIPLPIPNNQELKEKLSYYQSEREKSGLPATTEQPLMREVYISDDDEQAYQEVSPHLMKKYKTYASWGQEESSESMQSIENNFKEFCSNRFLIGGIDTITKEILNYEKNYGVSHLICRIHWPGMKQDQVLKTISMLGKCSAQINSPK